jgi:hypothetical protein
MILKSRFNFDESYCIEVIMGNQNSLVVEDEDKASNDVEMTMFFIEKGKEIENVIESSDMLYWRSESLVKLESGT